MADWRLGVGRRPPPLGHQCEDAPTQVLACVSRVPGGFGREFGSGLQDHLDDIAAEGAELLDELRRDPEVPLVGGMAALDAGLIQWLLAPVGLTDQHHAAISQTGTKQVNGPATPPPIQVAPTQAARSTGSSAT